MVDTWKRNPGLKAKIKNAQDHASKDFYFWRRNLSSIADRMYQKVRVVSLGRLLEMLCFPNMPMTALASNKIRWTRMQTARSIVKNL